MIAVFYSLALGKHRCITIYDAAKEQLNPPLPGEGVLNVDPQTFAAYQQSVAAGSAHDPIQDFLTQQTGLLYSEGRYVAVQNGVVQAVALGVDPACGDVPFKGTQWAQALIVANPLADIGYTYDGLTFTAPIIIPVQKGVALGS